MGWLKTWYEEEDDVFDVGSVLKEMQRERHSTVAEGVISLTSMHIQVGAEFSVTRCSINSRICYDIDTYKLGTPLAKN